MKKLYLPFSCGIIALGLVHMAATARLFASLTASALWFLCGGLVMVLTGALNLLNRSYGSVAPGLRRVCIAANIVLTFIGFISGRVGGASAIQLIIVVGLFAATTVLSGLGNQRRRPS